MTQISIALVVLGLMGLVGFLAWLRMGVDTGRQVAALEARVAALEASPRFDRLEARLSSLEALKPFVEDMRLKMSMEGR